MRKTICDKCGAETTVISPAADGWTERPFEPEYGIYFNFCPTCSKEYASVCEAAMNTYKATVKAWLNSVIEKSKGDSQL